MKDKICSKCKIKKQINEFYKGMTYCIPCTLKYHKERNLAKKQKKIQNELQKKASSHQ